MIDVKNKGKRPRQRFFQHPEGCVVYWLYIVRDMAQVIANKREIGFFRLYVPYPANGLDSPMIGNIAAKPVNRVRWINDQPAFAQYFNHLFNGFWIRVFRVDLD